MSRLPVAAFVALAAATVGAFFVVQHLKVSTPLFDGLPAPHPADINPIDGRVCKGVDHRSMRVSFYLLGRSDDVDVYIVARDRTTIVATLGSGVPMRVGVRRRFYWNGRSSDGAVAPDGTYYIRVALAHQGRSALISSNAGPLPVRVETVAPRPRVIAVSPDLIPKAGRSRATVRYPPISGAQGKVLVYRTDLPGSPRLVKSFPARIQGASVWDGTLARRARAPQGTYLIGLRETDRACNVGTFPPENPPVAGSTAHAGVTVRYLAALPPLSPVPAGAAATVYVDARQHAYTWALRAAGTARVLASGHARTFSLPVPVPTKPASTGLYELALRYGAARTLVPLVGNPPGASQARILVVLPALTWQGRNPVDDDGDGIPNTLTAGYPIRLARPLVDGLPAGWPVLAGLLTYLHRQHLRYALTTDLALLDGTGPALSGHAGVILAGDEPWVPARLAGALRAYVSRGGHVLSLGVDSLRRGVTIVRGRAYAPTAPRAADIFGARLGALTRTRGAFILAGRDRLGLFRGTSGAFRGFRVYQAFTGLTPPLRLASLAGPTTASPAIIGYHLGRGVVIELGLPGFGAALARSADAQELLTRIWAVLGHA